MALERVKLLNKEELLQRLRENDFVEVTHILQDREINGEKFIDLTEFEMFRWKLAPSQKKSLLSCLNQVRQKPTILIPNKMPVRATSFQEHTKPNLLKQQLESLLGPAGHGLGNNVASLPNKHLQPDPGNKANTNSHVHNTANKGASRPTTRKPLPPLPIGKKPALPLPIDNDKSKKLPEKLGPETSRSVKQNLEDEGGTYMSMKGPHQELPSDQDDYLTPNEITNANFANTSMMPPEKGGLPNRGTQTLPNRKNFGKNKPLPPTPSLVNLSENNELEEDTYELPNDEGKSLLSSNNRIARSAENLNLRIEDSEKSNKMDRSNKEFNQSFKNDDSSTDNSEESTAQNLQQFAIKKASSFFSLFKNINKGKTYENHSIRGENYQPRIVEIRNRPLPTIPVLTHEEQEPANLFSKPFPPPRDPLPIGIKHTYLEFSSDLPPPPPPSPPSIQEFDDPEAEEVYENFSEENHQRKDAMFPKKPLTLSSRKTAPPTILKSNANNYSADEDEEAEYGNAPPQAQLQNTSIQDKLASLLSQQLKERNFIKTKHESNADFITTKEIDSTEETDYDNDDDDDDLPIYGNASEASLIIPSQRRNSTSPMANSFRNELPLVNSETDSGSTYGNVDGSIPIYKLPLPSIPGVISPPNKELSKSPFPRQKPNKNVNTLTPPSTDDEQEYGNTERSTSISKKPVPMPSTKGPVKSQNLNMFPKDEDNFHIHNKSLRNGFQGSMFRRNIPKPPAFKPPISFEHTNVAAELSNDATNDEEDGEALYQQAPSYTVTDEPYYRDTTRRGAELLLRNAPNGSFLFRPPSNSNQSYNLVLTVKHKNKYYNLGIEKTADNKMRLKAYKDSEAPEFTTLSEFVDHFKVQPLGLREKNMTIEFYLKDFPLAN